MRGKTQDTDLNESSENFEKEEPKAGEDIMDMDDEAFYSEVGRVSEKEKEEKPTYQDDDLA